MRHASGRAGWWKPPSPDLVRASNEKPPGATRLRDGVEHFVLEPVGPDLEPFGVAAGTEIARLTTEGDQELGITVLADDASEAVVENAAIEELLDGALGCTAQAAVLGLELFLVDGHERLEVFLDEPVER
jgi:hypothetical protein